MIKNIVCQGQSFLDKVIECTGNIDNAFDMSVLNKRPMTDEVEIGEVLSSSTVTRKSVVALFNEKNRPATAYTELVNDYSFPLGEFPISF